MCDFQTQTQNSYKQTNLSNETRFKKTCTWSYFPSEEYIKFKPISD